MDEKKPESGAVELDSRARTIFREVVESYLSTGEPVGSRTISRIQSIGLSPASIRNTMSDLAQMGLLTAPHASAGRLPTHAGLRMFVDGLLQIGDLTEDERSQIDVRIKGAGQSMDQVLESVGEMVSGLAGGAGLVTTPARDAGLKHVEFVSLGNGQTMTVLVFEDGNVENRIMATPEGLTPSALVEAGNYLSARLKGRTLAQAQADIREELSAGQAALDEAAERLVSTGLAEWSGGEAKRMLIVRGRSRLLEEFGAAEDLERIRLLFDDLERKEELISLLDQTREAEGVRIFIGAENPLFSLSGSSLVVAPYMNRERKVVGALGVVGPTRLNYARVIPMIDYTARLVGRMLDNE
ncbi:MULTISPECIES: heat-inducible transcriptional repressor HrcA [Euryhalocaulis]|uniref:heat-inducible transcriptional repressor HrcA n=1 Tax=Euryhalocaulis TaxID=1712422 RepID=UPI00039A75B6|nr:MULTISPECIES: heat-inducible transcriptional repressor HrcA [Euryhalocaulis]MBA4802802.1 heat-inducible transcriptional repressor HrcA [Euryhalocaulis sp.]